MKDDVSICDCCVCVVVLQLACASSIVGHVSRVGKTHFLRELVCIVHFR